MLLPVMAMAANDATETRQWLDRMISAAHHLNYEGTFIYQHSGHLQTMQIVHSADEKGERERLISLSGPSREVIRDQDTVTCILPDNKSVMVEHAGPTRPSPFLLPTRLAELEKYYRFTLLGENRIAGRKVRELSIQPRDAYRYGHRFWVDEQSGLMLKSELLDEQGHQVEQLVFTSVKFYDKVPPALLKAQTEGKDFVWYRQNGTEDEDLEGDGHWRVRQSPPGFNKGLHRRHYMPTLKAPVEHLVFSDGLASVSVFVETRGDSSASSHALGAAKIGGANAYIRVIDGHRITVVGEVPPLTVKQIAEAVVHREGASDDD
jgi:sigma-E factor negative regulatory protein RseB